MSPLPALRPAVLALLIMTAPAAAGAEEEAKRRTISLTGTGIVQARPDTGHISTGVVSEGGTARAALDANTEAMVQVIGELKTQGIEAKDIQTVNFSVHPKYQHHKDGKPPSIVGYRVVNSVRITVRELARLGMILDKVVSHGSNQIGGIEFSVDDADRLQDEARKLAWADALRKAKLYMDASGARLGSVVSISEDASGPRPPVPYRSAALEAKARDVPVEAGEQSLQVRVNVTWRLD